MPEVPSGTIRVQRNGCSNHHCVISPRWTEFVYFSIANRRISELQSLLANEELDYLANGYFPGINLIQTFESQKHPLSGPTIESVIDTYFYAA